MQEASACYERPASAPHRDTAGIYSWTGIGLSSSIRGMNGGSREVMRMVEENAVIVFARRGCCMSYVVRRLLQALGANPAVYEVEDDGLIGQLADACGGGRQFPAVFIGGRWFGGPERIIAAHITEELTPLLKKAGALWL